MIKNLSILMLCEKYLSGAGLLHQKCIDIWSVSDVIIAPPYQKGISPPDKVILQAIRYAYFMILSVMPASIKTLLYSSAIFFNFGASFSKPVADPFTRTFLRVMATTGFNLFDHDL